MDRSGGISASEFAVLKPLSTLILMQPGPGPVNDGGDASGEVRCESGQLQVGKTVSWGVLIGRYRLQVPLMR